MTDLEVRRASPLMRLRPTPAVRKKLLEAMKSGATPDTAADAIGITWPVLERWLDRGMDALREDEISKEDEAYARLVIEVRQGLATFEVNALKRWDKHGDEEWQALRDMLERTRQEKYARPIRHTIGNADGLPFRIEIDRLESASLGELKAAKEALEKLGESDEIIDGEAVEIT